MKCCVKRGGGLQSNEVSHLSKRTEYNGASRSLWQDTRALCWNPGVNMTISDQIQVFLAQHSFEILWLSVALSHESPKTSSMGKWFHCPAWELLKLQTEAFCCFFLYSITAQNTINRFFFCFYFLSQKNEQVCASDLCSFPILPLEISQEPQIDKTSFFSGYVVCFPSLHIMKTSSKNNRIQASRRWWPFIPCHKLQSKRQKKKCENRCVMERESREGRVFLSPAW